MGRAGINHHGSSIVADKVVMARQQLGPRRRPPVTLPRPVIPFPILGSKGI